MNAPAAAITIELDSNGRTHLRSTFAGRFDASYAWMDDARLCEVEIPKLLAELRAQLQSLKSGCTE
ncbi:MAG: hypothetical protein ACSLE9_00855 [Burkholderiaceae bacterium]